MKKLLSKYNNLSIVAKASLWFTFATVLQKGISFITVPIFTRFMTTAQYGEFSVYLSWTGIFTIIGGMEFHTCIYINNYSKLNSESEKNDLLVSLENLTFIITTSLLMIYLINTSFWNSIMGMTTQMVLLMFTEVYISPIISLWSTKQRYNYHYKTLVIWSVGQVFASAFLGILLVYLAPNESQACARVISIVLIEGTFGFLLLIKSFINAKKIVVHKWWKDAIRIHLPLLPHNLSLTVLASCDRVMINNYIGSTETAIYSLAYSAAMVMNILKLSIIQAVTPWFYECIKHKKFDDIKNKCNALLLLIFSMVILFILFAPELIYLMGSNKYIAAIYVIPPVAASVFFTFLYNIFSMFEFYYEKTKGIMYASITAAILNIILNYIFIKGYGYIAAAYTTLFCYLFLSTMHYHFMKKIIRDELGLKEMFNMKFIIFMSGVTILSSICISFLYNNNVIRYLMIACLLLLLFLRKKSIAQLISKNI